MTRRQFLSAAAAIPAVAVQGAAAVAPHRFPLGLNTYCLRALRWNDAQLFEYVQELKLDAIFLQDSLDPRAMDPAHWAEVRQWTQDRGLHLETGGGAILPKTPADVEESVAALRKHIERARAMGSPLVRCLLASERASLPPGTDEQHLETAAAILRAAGPQARDAGLKLAVEVHKDFQAWQFRQLIETVGFETAGIYLDTGNPVFVMEDPMTTLEQLGRYALTVHLRDSVLYEHPRGAAVQWAPLGEGVIDFKAFLSRLAQIRPDVYVYVKPITGRPPAILPYLEPDFWTLYPKAKAADFARFLALVKKGRPYEKHIVIEDLQGRTPPPHFLPAIQYQQKEHMERSVAYAQKVLDLGIRWRQS